MAAGSGTLVNTPRRNRSVVISRKNRSTMFSDDAEVWREVHESGDAWSVSHACTAGCLCVA